jgi:hypothetical protein
MAFYLLNTLTKPNEMQRFQPTNDTVGIGDGVKWFIDEYEREYFATGELLYFIKLGYSEENIPIKFTHEYGNTPLPTKTRKTLWVFRDQIAYDRYISDPKIKEIFDIQQKFHSDNNITDTIETFNHDPL